MKLGRGNDRREPKRERVRVMEVRYKLQRMKIEGEVFKIGREKQSTHKSACNIISCQL